MKSKFTKGTRHGWRLREIITAAATWERPTVVSNRVERYLDDIALSNAVRVAEEEMKGYRA